MARVKRGVTSHQRHKRLLQDAEGRKGTKSRLIKPARQGVYQRTPPEQQDGDALGQRGPRVAAGDVGGFVQEDGLPLRLRPRRWRRRR